MSQISISRSTQDLLKNFITINKSIVIKPGNIISTLSVNKNIMSRCVVPEEFPKQASIYDLSVLIGSLGLTSDPVLDFSKENCLVVKDTKTKSKSTIYYSDPDMIVTPPDQDIQLPQPSNVQFTLNMDVLGRLKTAANVYAVPDLCLYGHDGVLSMSVTDKKNETSNIFSVELGETEEEFCFCFKMENLRLLPDTYTVTIAGGKVALFEGSRNNNGSIKYWIALEPDTSK
jgi:hypothetical protein